MEHDPELQKKADKGQIAIKGTISKPDKTGSAKGGEVRVPREDPQRPLPERAS